MRFPFPDVLKKGEGALLTSHIISVVKLSYKEIAGLYVCKPWLRANYLAVSKGNNDASHKSPIPILPYQWFIWGGGGGALTPPWK